MTTADIQDDLRIITNKLVTEYAPEKVILFGSFAWGQPKEDSDVDLFIVKETDNTRETARTIDGSIFPRPFPVDLIVYTPKQVKERTKMGDLFIKEILTKGKVLYAN